MCTHQTTKPEKNEEKPMTLKEVDTSTIRAGGTNTQDSANHRKSAKKYKI